MKDSQVLRKINLYKEMTEKFRLLSVYDSRYLWDYFPVEKASKEKILFFWKLFLREKNDPFLSLYTHIPFCKNSKCYYCMYNSKPLINSLEMDIYLKFLASQTAFFSSVFSPYSFSTFYIGGGTPSMMTTSQIERLLKFIFRHFRFKEGVGTKSMEFSPSTTTEAKIKAAKDNGINRVSLGVQSLDPAVLAYSNRRYVLFNRLEKIITSIKRENFLDFNVDLMACLPGDTLEKFSFSLEKMLEFEIPSVTVYFYRHSPERMKRTVFLKNNPLYAHYNVPYDRHVFFKTISSIVEKHGYSSVKNGPFNEFQRYYNARYCFPLIHFSHHEWSLRNSTLGLGLHARSFIEGGLEYCVANNNITNCDLDHMFYHARRYSPDFQMRRYVLRQFESGAGISLDWFEKIFKKSFLDVFRNEIDILTKIGKIKIDTKNVSFSAENIFEHAVYSKFFYDQEILMKAAQSAGLR